MSRSAELHEACELRVLSPQRALRIAALVLQYKPDEPSVKAWVKHAAAITIKRLNDEFRVLAVNGSRTSWPSPPGDREWFESIRRAPGDARALLERQSVAALASPLPTADVFLRYFLPAEVAVEFRLCIREAQRGLLAGAERALRLQLSPAAEVRQRPSARLAQKYVEAHKPLPEWLGLLAMLEEYAEEWDNPQRILRRSTDHITNRDGWRCTAPGCTARSLEVHHIVYQSRGGSDAAANLTSLCPFHHRMGEHGVLSKVTGEAPLRLQWRLGVGAGATRYEAETALQSP